MSSTLLIRLSRFSLALLCSVFAVMEAAAADVPKPLQVFVLVGQSNMQGHAHVRTLEHVGMSADTAGLLKDVQTEEGKPRIHEDVWISYLSRDGERTGQLTTGFGADENKIGPELAFGIYTQRRLQQPVLIIKAAWGGKSLHTDFRPPSAGPYQFNESQLAQIEKQGKDLQAVRAERAQATGHYYRLTVEHVKKVLGSIKRVYPDYDPKQGFELAGLVWFQGWNDMVDRGVYPQRDQPGGYDRYTEVFSHFIRDIRNDLGAPQLPIVIGVMGAGGPVKDYLPPQQRYAKIHQNFRDAMAAPAKLPEFQESVTAVLTENYWDQELTALRARDSEIKQQMKKLREAGEIDKQEERAAIERKRTEAFSPRELKVLEVGASNFEFHYLGSAKVMLQIGKGFAEALADDSN